MDSNEVVGWGTNKNEGGTFQGTVYTFKSLKDIDPETGTYCTKHKLIFNREFKTRRAAVYHCKKTALRERKIRKSGN